MLDLKKYKILLLGILLSSSLFGITFAYNWNASTGGDNNLPPLSELAQGQKIKSVHMKGFRNGLVDLNSRSWLKNGSSYYYNGGKVGIGTTSPSQKLEVNNGRIRIRNAGRYLDIGPGNSSYSHFYTDAPNYYFNKGIKVDTGYIGTYSDDLKLRTDDNVRLTIKSSNGNVGIGTTSPGAKLDVNGDIKVSGGSYRIQDNNGDWSVGGSGENLEFREPEDGNKL